MTVKIIIDLVSVIFERGLTKFDLVHIPYYLVCLSGNCYTMSTLRSGNGLEPLLDRMSKYLYLSKIQKIFGIAINPIYSDE